MPHEGTKNGFVVDQTSHLLSVNVNIRCSDEQLAGGQTIYSSSVETNTTISEIKCKIKLSRNLSVAEFGWITTHNTIITKPSRLVDSKPGKETTKMKRLCLLFLHQALLLAPIVRANPIIPKGNDVARGGTLRIETGTERRLSGGGGWSNFFCTFDFIPRQFMYSLSF